MYIYLNFEKKNDHKICRKSTQAKKKQEVIFVNNTKMV